MDLNNIGDNVLITPSMNMKMYLYKEIVPICDSILSISLSLRNISDVSLFDILSSSRASNVNQI